LLQISVVIGFHNAAIIISKKSAHPGNNADPVRTRHYQAINAFHSVVLQGLEFAEKKLF
jgi:hypothetical protein